MSTRPEAGSPDELAWLRGFEEGRNYVFQIHNEFLNGPYFQVQKEVHGLREENTRLREALIAIWEDDWIEGIKTHGSFKGQTLEEIARTALEEK